MILDRFLLFFCSLSLASILFSSSSHRIHPSSLYAQAVLSWAIIETCFEGFHTVMGFDDYYTAGYSSTESSLLGKAAHLRLNTHNFFLTKSSTYNHLLQPFISEIMHLFGILSKYKLKAFRGNVSDDDAIELTDMGSFHAFNSTSEPFPSLNDGEGAYSQSGKRGHATTRDRGHP